MSFAREHLSERQFQTIAQIIEQQVGIQLPPVKRTMVEGRLRKRVKALGLRSLDDYRTYLFDQGKLGEEVLHLIDCVTTNKTDFFREPAHFDFLCRTAIPRLTGSGSGSQLKIWSAACSIGAEAYTIAMVLQDMVRSGARFRFSILGTDISREVLDQARGAIYPQCHDGAGAPIAAAKVRDVVAEPAAQLSRIVPELRCRAQFHRLNLMDHKYPFDRDVDVIFCRNVLIYFDKPTQKAVLQRLASHLRPGGYLVLGHSETMAGGGNFGLAQVLPTIFQA